MYVFQIYILEWMCVVCHCIVTRKLHLCAADNRLEELQEKYSQEVEERKRLETELKVLQVKVSILVTVIMCVIILLVMITYFSSTSC